MPEEDIQMLREYDWDVFKAERCFMEHWFTGDIRVEVLRTEHKELEVFYSTLQLEELCDTKELTEILRGTDAVTMQLVKLKIAGYTWKDAAMCLTITSKAAYNRIARLKKKLKKYDYRGEKH